MKTLNKDLTVKDLEVFYDDVAKHMGKNWQKNMYKAPHQVAKFNEVIRIIKSLNLSGGNILELGSANGMMTKYLSEIVGETGNIDAVEISSVAIKNSPKFDNVTYIHDDVTNYLDNTDKYYDLIVATEVLEHVLDFEETLRLCFVKGTYVLVSMPISEEINEKGAFNSELIGKEKHAGDATGHLRIITPEELKTKFKLIKDYWCNDISVIVGGIG